jgi:hypothetical protein
MDRIIIEGVRCFYERRSVLLKPITLLTGENSTGKTTFLAMVRLAWDACNGRVPVDFNEEPFILGPYDEVASYRGGRAGSARTFTIGTEIATKGGKPGSPARITAVFGKKEGQPALTSWSLVADDVHVKVSYGEADATPYLRISGSSGRGTAMRLPASMSERPVPEIIGMVMFSTVGELTRRQGLQKRHGHPSLSSLRDLAKAGREMLRLRAGFFQTLGSRPHAFAPIRSRPHRTYDPMRGIVDPEGSHVPSILVGLAALRPAAWNRFRPSLRSFGEASGLFSDLKVLRMGKKESGPFQIQVKISGPAFNLMDVGYGVSQVLPIVVDSLRGEKGSTFLLQQPEVHLHPKAQAELGSFLALLAKEHQKRFLIETHSDYLVDRIRMEVRDGKVLKPEDVSLLYFERADGDVRIHSLEIDRMGNIVNAPKGYRQFFLEEEKRLLGG